jgi:hypothetical protein
MTITPIDPQPNAYAMGALVDWPIFLADRRYRAANAKVRMEVLGNHHPARTIVTNDVFEAVAAG